MSLNYHPYNFPSHPDFKRVIFISPHHEILHTMQALLKLFWQMLMVLTIAKYTGIILAFNLQAASDTAVIHSVLFDTLLPWFP